MAQEVDKYKKMYEQYKQSRDAELDKFWKNSTYVWTFLGLCFTAYSVLIIKFIDTDGSNFKLQLSLSAICTFGLLLSFVWRWMAQGLKAWYEVFEYAIWDMESYHNVFKYPPNFNIGNYWVVDEDSSSRPYSPSALVVSIGCCMIVFWIVAFVFNIVSYYCDFFCDVVPKENTANINKLCCCVVQTKSVTEHQEISSAQNHVFWIINGILALVDIVVLVILYRCKIKSSSLRTVKYEEKFNEIKGKLLSKGIPYTYLEVKHKSDKDIIRLVFDKKYKQDAEKESAIIQEFIKETRNKNQSYKVIDEYIKQ